MGNVDKKPQSGVGRLARSPKGAIECSDSGTDYTVLEFSIAINRVHLAHKFVSPEFEVHA